MATENENTMVEACRPAIDLLTRAERRALKDLNAWSHWLDALEKEPSDRAHELVRAATKVLRESAKEVDLAHDAVADALTAAALRGRS